MPEVQGREDGTRDAAVVPRGWAGGGLDLKQTPNRMAF